MTDVMDGVTIDGILDAIDKTALASGSERDLAVLELKMLANQFRSQQKEWADAMRGYLLIRRATWPGTPTSA